MVDDGATKASRAISWTNASLAVLGALMAGTVAVLASKLGKFTPSVGVYHAALYGAFFMMYWLIPGGFEAHFATPTTPVNASDVAYYTAVTHATIGYGDMYPKTRTARMLVTAHVFLAFIALANIVPLGDTVFSYSTFVVGE